jgi:hypothetical protein
MKDGRSFKIWSVGAAVIALSLLAAAALWGQTAFVSQGPKPEKICPITFVLDPVTSLQQRFATDTEKANADLAVILVALRSGVPIPELAQRCATLFASTYLARPILWTESSTRVPPQGFPGKEYQFWEEVLGYLKVKVIETDKAIYLHPQSVRVYLEYLPLENQTGAYMREKSVDLKGISPNDIDFLANIRTVLAYAPYDDPLIIGNAAPVPHRKVCEPIY